MNQLTPEERLADQINKAVAFEAKQDARAAEEEAIDRASPYHLREKSGYIVRIELHGIEERKRYQQLHAYLEDAAFSNVIANNKGTEFKLPAATYYFDNPGNRISYREVHARAAKGVQAALEGAYLDVKEQNDKPTILVTKTDLMYWSGLDAPDPVTE